MGVKQHRFLILESYNDQALSVARRIAVESFGPLVSGIYQGTVNCYSWVIVFPTGSNVGWSIYNDHELKLKQFMSQTFEHVTMQLVSIGELENRNDDTYRKADEPD